MLKRLEPKQGLLSYGHFLIFLWDMAHMGHGPYGPRPIWAKAHMGQGPYGPGPIWARAHMGPGPLGPGPFLVGQTPHQKTHPGKKSPNCVFCVFFGNKKDARRPYDHFGGGIAPRSLLCVRKRRFLVWAKTLILDLSGDRNNKYIRAVYIFY